MMQINEPSGPRFDLALERLDQGFSFGLGKLNFSLSSKESGVPLEIGVRTQWSLENVTEETAREEFATAISPIDQLRQENSKFASLLQEHPITLLLVNDYGTGM